MLLAFEAKAEAKAINSLTLLQEKDFTLLLIGQFISSLGDKLNYIALGVLVYRITGSALDVGKVTLATFLPYLFFGLIAGAFVDRWDKKRTMISADLLRALLVCFIPAAIYYSMNYIYLIAFLSTTATLFFSPAKMAVIPAIFCKEKILTATSLAESSENITEVLGYALAGGLTVLIRIEHVFYIDALTFLVSALSILLMSFKFEKSLPDNEASGRQTQIFREIRNGLTYIRQNKILADTLLTYCIVLILFSGMNPLIFVYALQALGVSPVGLGVLEATMAVGITVGSLALSAWGSLFMKKKLIFLGYFSAGISVTVLGLYPWFPLAVLGFFLNGVANSLFLIPIQSIFQEETAAAMRGRVFSARFASTRVAYLMSIGLLSMIANSIGVEKTYFISGLAVLSVTFILTFAFRRRDLL